MAAPIPSVEVADDADAFSVWSPHDKADAVDAFVLDQVRAEPGVKAAEIFCGMLRLCRQAQIRIGEDSSLWSSSPGSPVVDS